MRITKVCCALHNMCERYNSPFEQSWFPEPERYKSTNLNRPRYQVLPEDDEDVDLQPRGATIRSALANYCWSMGYR